MPSPSSVPGHGLESVQSAVPVGDSSDNHPVVIDTERVGVWRSREIDESKFTIAQQETMPFAKGRVAWLIGVDTRESSDDVSPLVDVAQAGAWNRETRIIDQLEFTWAAPG